MTSRKITRRQAELLSHIRAAKLRGVDPSHRELAAAMGIKASSHAAVHYHLAALERLGVLRRGRGPRSIVLVEMPA